MENPKFTIFKSGDSYYWRLRAKNGEIILNGEAYTTKQACKDGIQSVKVNAPIDSRYERKESRDGQYYFTLTAANNKTLGRSEMYKSKQGMENGIDAVKRDAPGAPIEDITENN
jgi:uncharacterized protein YegP (UPF0339 family)